MSDLKELYPVGEHPPLGYVPPKMYAWTVRAERFGEPTNAWQVEVIDVPEPAETAEDQPPPPVVDEPDAPAPATDAAV